MNNCLPFKFDNGLIYSNIKANNTKLELSLLLYYYNLLCYVLIRQRQYNIRIQYLLNEV